MTSLGIVQMCARTDVSSCAPHVMLKKFLRKFVCLITKKKKHGREYKSRSLRFSKILITNKPVSTFHERNRETFIGLPEFE